LPVRPGSPARFVFHHEIPFQRLLHNETAYAIQRRLQYSSITTVSMPVRAVL